MNIGVVGNLRYDALRGVLKRLSDYAAPRGHQLFAELALREIWPRDAGTLEPGESPIDLLVTFGGDGTVLRGVRLLDGHEVPILAMNLGKIGFLTSSGPDALEEAVEAFERGEHAIEFRTTVLGTVHRADGTVEEGQTAVNDVVVHKTGSARLIRIRAFVGDENVGLYTADGMIVATPTGSTAYSLSAGGPVLLPDVDALVVTAISPHTLRVRPIVVPADQVVTLEVVPSGAAEVAVSFDGQLGGPLGDGDRVEARRGPHRVSLVRVARDGFFTWMRQKLEWGDLSNREHADRAD
jgi:NAD+ kinase